MCGSHTSLTSAFLRHFSQTLIPNVQVCSMPVDFDWLWHVFSVFCRKSVISTGLLSVLHVTSTLLWIPWLSTICLSTSWGSSRSQMPGYVLLGLAWPRCATRATFRLHLRRTKAGGVGFTNFYLLDLKDPEWNEKHLKGESKKNRDFSLTHLNRI